MSVEEKEKKSVGEVVRENLQKIVIVIVSLIYIVQGLFTLQTKNATILDILGSIAISVVVGVIISASLNSMGVKDGRKSNAFIQSIKTYGETKEKATEYFDKLQAWCDYKNTIELEAKRKEVIQNAGLKWKLYKVGYYEKNTPKQAEQVTAIDKAKHMKIEHLTPNQLLSDLPNSKLMKKRFGEDEHGFQVRNFFSDLVSRIGVGVVCGMFGLAPLITEDNVQEKLANMLWNTMQISMWITIGLTKYASAKAFIENEYRQTHIIQKTELLNEFIVTCQKCPEVFEKFDEDAELNEFIKELTNGREKSEEIVHN